MTFRRLLLVIAVVTFLGLITTWQQIQTMRWGYRISEATEQKKKLLEEQKTMEIQLAQLTSPQQLLALGRGKGIAVDYRTGMNLVNAGQAITAQRQPNSRQVAHRDSGE